MVMSPGELQNRLGVVQGAAFGEDGEPAEDALLFGREQVSTPGEGSTESLVAVGHIGAAFG